MFPKGVKTTPRSTMRTDFTPRTLPKQLILGKSRPIDVVCEEYGHLHTHQPRYRDPRNQPSSSTTHTSNSRQEVTGEKKPSSPPTKAILTKAPANTVAESAAESAAEAAAEETPAQSVKTEDEARSTLVEKKSPVGSEATASTPPQTNQAVVKKKVPVVKKSSSVVVRRKNPGAIVRKVGVRRSRSGGRDDALLEQISTSLRGILCKLQGVERRMDRLDSALLASKKVEVPRPQSRPRMSLERILKRKTKVAKKKIDFEARAQARRARMSKIQQNKARCQNHWVNVQSAEKSFNITLPEGHVRQSAIRSARSRGLKNHSTSSLAEPRTVERCYAERPILG